MKPLKTFFIISFGMLIGVSLYFDLFSYFNLNTIQEQHAHFETLFQAYPLLVPACYVLIYIFVAALSIPGATLLSLLGGALFGTWLGVLLINMGASLGASLAFLSSRFIFRDMIESRFPKQVHTFNQGLSNGPLSYLLFLRLVPLFPFFLINLGLGITRLKLSTFFWGSFLGMIPVILVYANAGNQLSSISNVSDIGSPRLIFAFSLLGLFALIPVIYKKWPSKKK